MAENILQTRIQLKYDTLARWNSSSIILKIGEVAIAEVPSEASNSGLQPPAIGIKVGNGVSRFVDLPWIQAAAGDVYSWAKQASPPTAASIPGIDAYIAGKINDTDTQYQIIKRNDTFVLQEKGLSDATWTDVSTIDFSNIYGSRLTALENWIGDRTEDYTLANCIGRITRLYIQAQLNYDDPNATDGQFVTSVTQTSGKISVNRRAIKTTDITRPEGTAALSVDVGGTGRTTFDYDKVLVGNGTSALQQRSIEDTTPTENSTALITSGAVRSYVDTEIAALNSKITKALRFCGLALNDMETGINEYGRQYNPGIDGYPSSAWQKGDVIIDGTKEYIYTGTGASEGWQLLGDESSYIVHGSITNSDFAQGVTLPQSRIANLTSDLANKVDKEEGKGLSSNDYTSAEKTKLSNIQAGAQVNTIESVYVKQTATSDPVELDITNKSVTIDLSNVGQVKGARVPNTTNDGYENINLDGNTGKLEFARIAKTGDIADLQQPLDDYNVPVTILVLNCGSATTVI